MPLKSLEHLATKVIYETLPANWNTFDLARFSPAKQLWDYQQTALKLALSVLCKYYEDFADYEPGEDVTTNGTRKEKFTQWYEDGMSLTPKERASLNLSLRKAKLAMREMVGSFLPLDEEDPPAGESCVTGEVGGQRRLAASALAVGDGDGVCEH